MIVTSARNRDPLRMATITAEIDLPVHLIPEVFDLVADLILTLHLAKTSLPSQQNQGAMRRAPAIVEITVSRE